MMMMMISVYGLVCACESNLQSELLLFIDYFVDQGA